MKFLVTGEEMKAAENGISAIQLMENAGTECYKKISEILGGVQNRTFTVVCGSGNNGGDGIVLAHRIKDAGGEVLCVYVNDFPTGAEAKESYDKYSTPTGVTATTYTLHEMSVKEVLRNSEIIIDAVYGTGFHGALDAKSEALISFVNSKCGAFKISIDIPSGVNADTGEITPNAFKPDITLCLGAVKKGMISHPTYDFCGNIILLDIGIPQSCFSSFTAGITENEILSFIPARKRNSHKGDFGRLLNISGSERYTGAALLSTRAAYKVGAGLVALASVRGVCNTVISQIPEATLIPLFADENGFMDDEAIDELAPFITSYSAVILGCGIGMTKYTRKIVDFVLKNCWCPIILDADGINSIAGNINVLKDNDKPKILTPHPLEFSRLIGVEVSQIEAHRIDYAKDFAVQYNVTLVLKGVNTVIASPDGRVSVNPTGNAGLSKAGAGDVLSGIIGGLAAQGMGAFEAAVLGVYLHGLAADKLSESMALSGIMPSDVADILPFVMKI